MKKDRPKQDQGESEKASATGSSDMESFLVENGFTERAHICRRCGLRGEDCGCEPSGDFE